MRSLLKELDSAGLILKRHLIDFGEIYMVVCKK
jgi:hypothetical protein